MRPIYLVGCFLAVCVLAAGCGGDDGDGGGGGAGDVEAGELSADDVEAKISDQVSAAEDPSCSELGGGSFRCSFAFYPANPQLAVPEAVVTPDGKVTVTQEGAIVDFFVLD